MPLIDIETCELNRWHSYYCDPYGLTLSCEMQSNRQPSSYVRSPTSNGWIDERDLPVEKLGAMYDRHRAQARAVEGCMRRASDVRGWPLASWKWEGDGEEPSLDRDARMVQGQPSGTGQRGRARNQGEDLREAGAEAG